MKPVRSSDLQNAFSWESRKQRLIINKTGKSISANLGSFLQPQKTANVQSEGCFKTSVTEKVKGSESQTDTWASAATFPSIYWRVIRRASPAGSVMQLCCQQWKHPHPVSAPRDHIQVLTARLTESPAAPTDNSSKIPPLVPPDKRKILWTFQTLTPKSYTHKTS